MGGVQKPVFTWFMRENLAGLDGPWHWDRLLSSQVLEAAGGLEGLWR